MVAVAMAAPARTTAAIPARIITPPEKIYVATVLAAVSTLSDTTAHFQAGGQWKFDWP
jgi:hypothetical protein